MKFKIVKKNLITIIGGPLLAFIFLWLAPILAYDDKTVHPDLTREIIDFYELSGGKKLTDEQKQWIIQGSIAEDAAPRWLNHFYDPIFERGLDTSMPFVNGYSLKNWGLYSKYQLAKLGQTGTAGVMVAGLSDPSSMPFVFSYEAGIERYAGNKEKDAYITLGHILHLIEDLTVPEHTRNDAHPGGPDSSNYENWTKENSTGLTQNLGKRLFVKGNKPVIYTDLESYFNNLATYTNTHFFSPDTINSNIYLKPKIVYEDGTFAYGKDENGEFFDLVRIKANDRNKEYSLDSKQVLQEYWIRLSRQTVINGAGVIQLFLNQAEAAKQVELVKQKVDAQQTAQKSSFLSQIFNFFRSPEAPMSEPALTIKSEPTPVMPKINQIQPKPLSVNVNPKPVAPQTSVKPSVPTQNPPAVSQNPPVTAQTQTNQTTQQPQSAAPVVYSGGGGGGSTSLTTSGGSSSNTQQTATTTESLNVQTFNAGDLVINEIMHNPAGTDTDHEWIEIYNNSSREIDLTGWKFNDGDDETKHGLNVPPKNNGQGSMILPANGYAILAEDAATFLTDYPGFSGTVIDTVALNLKQPTSTVTTLKIIAPSDVVIDEVTYYNSWGGNDNGKSLERKFPIVGNSNDAANWGFSSVNGGTPGAVNNWFIASTTPETATSTLATATSSPSLIGLGTDVSATTTIAANTTWTLAGSPYRLFFNSVNHPIVASGAVLTIEPGVKIIPQGGGYTALEIQGTLSAIATSGAPIIFTSIADADGLASTTPEAGEWLNIAFSQGSQVNLDYVEFRYGGQGITLPLNEMVNIVGATINIKNSKFENSQSTALHLVDSSGIVENSIFSDSACGISVDSANGVANTSYAGCYGIHTTGQILSVAPQIKNNQFIRNRFIGVEVRSGTAPTISGNIFTDNGYPVKIESSYPAITDSQLTNSTTSPDILNGIAISGYTHFSHDFTLKNNPQLPYILETNGLSPYVDAGATLTIEPGAVFKIGHTFTALNVNGSLIASTTPDNPIVFTSLKDDARGGDTNGDGSATSPQDNDWANIKFFAGSIGSFANTIFSYGGYGYIAPSPVPVINQNTWIGDQNCDTQYCDSVWQQFTAASNSAGETTLKINAGSNGTSTISVDLHQDDNDGRGVLISNLGVIDLTNFVEEKTINITANFSIGTKYWISLSKISGATNTIHYRKNQNNYGIEGQLKGGVFTDYGLDSLYLIIASNGGNNPNAPMLSIDSGATVIVQ